MKASKYLTICVALAAAASLSACQDDTETFANSVYVDGAPTITNLLLDGDTETATYSIETMVPQPAEQEISITYVVDPAMVDIYNQVYQQNTVILPEQFYSIVNPKTTIGVGQVSATPVTLNLQNLDNIDQDYTYCLPVTLKSASIPVLANMATKYYIIRGASLINWVANLNENYLSMANPSSAIQLSGMNQITCEALIRPNSDFGDGNDAGISTWLGIEGVKLLRFGDSGIDQLQLQFASSYNVSSSQWTIEKEKWQFITFTYDATTGVCQFYVDGVQKGGDISSSNRTSVSWNSSSFYIGKSYSDNRDFSGDMAEVRVWNRILTKDEINSKNHFYKVDPDADGLVAYWKMNEGAGNVVADYANGYNLNANAPIDWVSVALPR